MVAPGTMLSRRCPVCNSVMVATATVATRAAWDPRDASVDVREERAFGVCHRSPVHTGLVPLPPGEG